MVVQSREVDEFGHVRLGGIGDVLAREIRQRTGFDTRVTVLGYVQRGGTPTAFDRVLATRFGIAAIDAVHDGAFGHMVALRNAKIVRVPLAEAVDSLKTVDPDPSYAYLHPDGTSIAVFRDPRTWWMSPSASASAMLQPPNRK